MPKPSTVAAPAELLAYLFDIWPDLKKRQIRTWLKFQAVTVNGRPVTQFNHQLNPGDVVAIRSDRFAQPKSVVGAGIKVFFEDAHIFVIDKPDGLLSIASDAEPERTAYFQLTEYLRQNNPQKKDRVWIVHRLDRQTSGLMVFAKSPIAKSKLQQSWDDVDKLYEAVVEGHLPKDEGTFESDLDESNPFRVFSTRASPQTRHAVTLYRVIARTKTHSLVALKLLTGRRHQIRVHLADAGCPIVGDKKYHANSDPANRLGLHASGLRFSHPETGEKLDFKSPLPKILSRIIRGQ